MPDPSPEDVERAAEAIADVDGTRGVHRQTRMQRYRGMARAALSSLPQSQSVTPHPAVVDAIAGERERMSLLIWEANQTGALDNDTANALASMLSAPPPKPPAASLPQSQPLLETTQVAEAMQTAWDEFCVDTGCIPDAFTIHGPGTTRVVANFSAGNFARHVTEWLTRCVSADMARTATDKARRILCEAGRADLAERLEPNRNGDPKLGLLADLPDVDQALAFMACTIAHAAVGTRLVRSTEPLPTDVDRAWHWDALGAAAAPKREPETDGTDVGSVLRLLAKRFDADLSHVERVDITIEPATGRFRMHTHRTRDGSDEPKVLVYGEAAPSIPLREDTET